ncbi:putative protein kinase RLK-Pelle-LRR-XI-1 family [Rosa chinensis]|uniref:Protein kinase domain-containing protein n=2 Tax=Rosa chinensis TaxID=74649 RepID=A0A2P6QB58_ROSCH|nr:receptor-like protein kinase HSL1 isoform X2 [Rosa chinensis]PRQ31411.1 putative protein kinase RLK-Pelle-LRR-XI-1 family [Rosa chinensis]
MACFAQSAEHFTQAYCLMSSQNSNIEAGDVEAATGAVLGGVHFKSLGMRCLQCAGILLLWFFGPIPMFVSSVALVIFLHYNYTGRQYHVRNRVDSQMQSFQKLRFCEAEILCALCEDNVIGRGPSGKVYKVESSNGTTIAVKKLQRRRVNQCENNDVEKDMVHDDGLIAGFDTLGRITHKNIMKLWHCCTTRDCQQLLVYDYMPNGSLGDFLHNKKAGLLNWPTRFKIALGAAEGISYLHHDCSPSIVHRNVKSNNILLDGDFEARVVDIGTTNGVDASGKGPVIAAACGYIAPEFLHAHGLNGKSDIYNFGVVMLELVTGKLPVNPELGEKDLVKWVRSTLDQKGVDHVLDPKLDSCYKEEVCKVLDIGLLCTDSRPDNRPSMRRVMELLQEVGRGASPYC